jgi:predicted molibdopterin-dependent oxidoreductase YjgC
MMDYRTIYTICPFCGTGCGMLLEVMNGRLAGVLPCKTNSINEGKLCIKGWSAHEFVESPERLKKPQIRKEGRLEEVEWDEALSFIASRLKAIRSAHGPDSFGALSSAKCTNEENYLFQKFTRVVIGTNNVDHCARL